MQHDSLVNLLRFPFAEAIARVAGTTPEATDPMVRPAGEPQFGDYQCNAAMSLAKALKSKPREVAAKIVAEVQPALADIAEPLEIAGPGFINIRLRREFLSRYLGDIPAPGANEPDAPAIPRPAPEAEARGQSEREPDVTGANVPSGPHSQGVTDRVGIPRVKHPLRVVVEYSQPNIAKQMHVGHLRSTIIGDVFARVLAFEGHDVIRQNHIGDWGTAMGAVILGLWYARACKRRPGDTSGISDFQQRIAALNGKPQHERKTALADICRQWTKDLAETPDDESGQHVTLEQLEQGYVFVQTLMDVAAGTGATIEYHGTEERLENAARKVTAMLQVGGDANKYERRDWEEAKRISLDYCQKLYERLRVLLNREDVRGESFYALGDEKYRGDRLPGVIAELKQRLAPPPTATDSPSPDAVSTPHDRAIGTPNASEGPASAPRGRRTEPEGTPDPAQQPRHAGGIRGEVRDDQGAVVVYLYDEKGEPLFKNPDGEILGMIVQKSDGAYLYATTDLAAIRFRLKELRFATGVGAQRIIYVTDARQKLHFQMFFAAARAAGWIADRQVDHVTFGSVLGTDRKPLKTRAGGTIKLSELLEEAEARARQLLEEREAGTKGRGDEGGDAPEALSASDKQEIARRVGIAALKYADLRNDRNADYVFDWDKMLALQGNTAPYMMYAYARIRSIYRKAAERFGSPDVYAPHVSLGLAEPAERTLALRLARLREAIDTLAADLTPHTLCTYLYELAGEFMRFYETCPVLAAPDEPTRLSRMRLCDLTARTLKLGLYLLGIEVVERM